LRKDNAELKQTLDAQIAAVKSECARELEEVRIQVRRSGLSKFGVRLLTQCDCCWQHSTNVQMEVDTIEHQLSEVNEENTRLKKELNAVRRQLQHVTQVSQSLIAARAEMQATAAAAATSAGQAEPRKIEKKEKAPRKKRKKDDRNIGGNHTAGKAALSPAIDLPTDIKTDDLVQTEETLLPESDIETTQTESNAKSQTKTDVDIAGTADQSAATSIEIEVVEVVNETVEKVVQAGTQDADHAADTRTDCLQRSDNQFKGTFSEPEKCTKASAHETRKDNSKDHHGRAEVERNYVGNDNMLKKLRESDFESKAHHDCNELRAEVRHDYSEAHMADVAGHTHLSIEHKHSEAKDAEVDIAEVDIAKAEAEAEAGAGAEAEAEGSANGSTRHENQEKMENIVEKKSEAQQAQTVEQSSGLSMTDQLKNRLERLKKASAAANASRSGAANTVKQASATAWKPVPSASEKTQQVEAASESGEGQSKENQPPTPARSSRKRRTTGKVDEVRETIESFPPAYAHMHLCTIPLIGPFCACRRSSDSRLSRRQQPLTQAATGG
jgi:hypothetical protein